MYRSRIIVLQAEGLRGLDTQDKMLTKPKGVDKYPPNSQDLVGTNYWDVLASGRHSVVDS